MIKLRYVVEHITYQNPENGWSVMKANVKGYKDLVTLTGSLLDIPVCSVLLCEGNWKVDARYGQQFIVESWQRRSCLLQSMGLRSIWTVGLALAFTRFTIRS